MKTAYVIGNCQVRSLAETMNYFSQDVNFCELQINSRTDDKVEEYIEKNIKEIKISADFILAFYLSDKFLGLAASRIKETFPDKPVLFFSNLFFAGYHPDVAVLGAMGGRVDGPLNQYRSRIVLNGFVNGWSKPAIAATFNDHAFRALKFYDKWDQSVQDQYSSDSRADLQFGEKFVSMLKKDLCLYSVNHPTPRVFREWAKFLCKELDARGMMRYRDWEPDLALMPAYFPDTSVYPVYPEVATAMGLEFAGSYVFKGAGFAGSSFMSLDQFIDREIAALESVGAESIKSQPQWKQIEKQFSALG